jgi:predicted transposase YbfD/YdcC
VAIEEWATLKKECLSEILDLSSGIPSHDTLGRVFSVLSPEAFQAAFIEWARELGSVTGEVVAVDGKTLRRSHARAEGRGPIHMVSAWCAGAGVALGQLKTSQKSNEIEAVPRLLDLLHLKGGIVTLDAMGCQRAIASKIVEKEADYLLQVKGDQPNLLRAMRDWFDEHVLDDPAVTRVVTASQASRGHRREEERNLWLAPVPTAFAMQSAWAGLRSIVWVESIRTLDGARSTQHRYYIRSRELEDASAVLDALRAHWSIENNLHWVLDIAFREDESRVRVRRAAENLARLRHFALNLLKRETTARVGIKTKRLMGGWDGDDLLEVFRAAA